MPKPFGLFPSSYSAIGRKSGASAKLVDLPAVTLGGAAHRRGREMHRGFPFFRHFASGFSAGFGFPIERLRNSGGSTNVTQLEDFHLEVSAFGSDLKHIADVNFPRRLGRLLVGLDASEFASPRSHRTGLEET